MWCNHHGIELQFIQPGKPTQKAYIENLNGLYRRDILDAYMFETLDDVCDVTEEWIKYYKTEKPHASLGDVTTREYLLE